MDSVVDVNGEAVVVLLVVVESVVLLVVVESGVLLVVVESVESCPAASTARNRSPKVADRDSILDEGVETVVS